MAKFSLHVLQCRSVNVTSKQSAVQVANGHSQDFIVQCITSIEQSTEHRSVESIIVSLISCFQSWVWLWVQHYQHTLCNVQQQREADRAHLCWLSLTANSQGSRHCRVGNIMIITRMMFIINQRALNSWINSVGNWRKLTWQHESCQNMASERPQ